MPLLRRALLPLLLFAATLANAQSVHWENGDSSLGTVVQLVFEDCEPDGDPQLPTMPNVVLSPAGRQTSMNVVNMSVSRSVTLTYVVQARGGPLQIPAFTVKTNKGPIRVAAFNGTIASQSVASSAIIVTPPTVWAGEIFSVQYKLLAARRYNPQFENFAFDWSPAPAVIEEWSKPSGVEAVVDGQKQIVITDNTRGYIKTAGTYKLDAAHQVMNVQTGSASFGLFTQPRMEPVAVTSEQPTVEVRPLPAPPVGFTGAVGQFKLTSKVIPSEAAPGEPITWTLELTGSGNWPDIAGLPAREVSKDFQVVQPKAKKTNEEGKLFDATLTEDVVLIPTKAGRYTLGPVSFTFFNPKTGKYETLHTDQVSVTIATPNIGAQTPSIGVPATSSTDSTESTEARRPPPPTPAAPTAIPRDPLPGQGNAARPLTTKALVSWLLVPPASLLLFWLGLAWRRAAQTDPLRPQREAQARLAATLAKIGELHARTTGAEGDSGMLSSLLLAWQHDAAILFKIPHAAPAAMALPEPEWATLWREADRALYGPKASLPSDWTARAQAALASKRVRGFNPARLFLPSNLLAFAAALALTFVAALPSVRAATPAPEAAYRAGNFAAAEKAWREIVAQHPTDWVARHNLSLALAQQDRAPEAAAHAVAAFVQHPDEPALRWHFTHAVEKGGFTPGPLQAFLHEGPVAAIATFASPAGWQRILIGSAFAVAAALGWLLWNAYGRRSALRMWLALTLGAGATLAGIVALFGFVAYGETADARAVITWQAGTLRSIPTEADTSQKTTALSPGSVALVDKTFLPNDAWLRLSFSNGQTGWVRKEDVVPLWR
jgi:hypothetical protein